MVLPLLKPLAIPTHALFHILFCEFLFIFNRLSLSSSLPTLHISFKQHHILFNENEFADEYGE